MSSLLAQISSFLPIFLASPTVYAGMILIMSSTNYTRLRVFAALVGSSAAIIVIGVIAITAGGAVTKPEEPSAVSGIINLALAAALILLVIWVLFRKKPKPRDQKKARPPEDPAAGPKFLKYVFYGILLVVTNPTSLASYFSSAKLTLDSELEAGQQAIAMLVAGFYFCLTVLIPGPDSAGAPADRARAVPRVPGAGSKHPVEIRPLYHRRVPRLCRDQHDREGVDILT